MKNFLIVLLGPTGVGKTDISVNLAELLNCDIISADSRQFFREMKIGTAVPSGYQLKKVKHHFIQFISVKEYYSASLYERDVINLLPALFTSNNTAILTGGSGLYIDAVCDGYDDIPDVDPDIRQKYINMYRENGIESLRYALKLLDPEHFSKVDLKNHKRILRALEICESTGHPYSSFLKNKKRTRDFTIIKIGIQRDRKQLYDRINTRVDEMVANGLEEESRQLYDLRHLNALKSVGYREFFEFFDNKFSRNTAIELIKRNSRRYAKRQLTWWAKDDEIKWFNAEEEQLIINYIDSYVKPAL